MNAACCDRWRPSSARWCPDCGASLRDEHRAWWRIHADALGATAALLAALALLHVSPREEGGPRADEPQALILAPTAVARASATATARSTAPSPVLSLAAETPPRCTLLGEPVRVGRRARVDSLSLRVDEGRVELGWVVAAARRRGSEGVAAQELDAEARVLATPIAEDPPAESGVLRNVLRVVSLPSQGGAPRHAWDERTEASDGESVRCGALQGSLSALGDVAGGLFTCRTIATSAPFVLGLRSVASTDGTGAPEVEVVAARLGEREAAPVGWRLPVRVSAREVARRPLHKVLFDRFDLEGATGADVAGAVVVAFRYRGRLHVGWLDGSLRARGELRRVDTLGGEVGLPRAASNGAEALIVFADRGPTPPRVRGQVRPTPPPYRLYGVRATSSTLDAPAGLATRAGVELDEFAPTPAPLPDGGWVVAWSEGPRHTRRGEEAWRHVLLRRYRADLSADGGPAEAFVGSSASDARVASLGDRLVVAAAEGRGRARSVVVRAGRCESAP